MYFDREGNPMSQEAWSALHGDMEYKVVKQETVGAYFVSTVWLGLDHSFGHGGPPIIFETMIFSDSEIHDPEHRGLHDMECWRYSTEAEARAGHEEVVTLVRATSRSVEDVLGECEVPPDVG